LTHDDGVNHAFMFWVGVVVDKVMGVRRSHSRASLAALPQPDRVLDSRSTTAGRAGHAADDAEFLWPARGAEVWAVTPSDDGICCILAIRSTGPGAAAIGAAAKPRSDWREKITPILVALRLRRSREVQRAVDLLPEAVSVKMKCDCLAQPF
jgi:hypothetical protein